MTLIQTIPSSAPPKVCAGNHRRITWAVVTVEGRPFCSRHANRVVQDIQIAQYLDGSDAPRCPYHPDKRPAVTRWHSQSEPRLYCPTGLGERVVYRAQGFGRMRSAGGQTYVEWCQWQHEIPAHVLQVRR